ncbi:uncharacterized protein LAESUDRAFT_716247 [Laetiporus sulphureus 93-53]|uniref:Zn(2)-C6 fungal-type domain-containing protein n=1 Tax=Laetiporus sulphureus 93-53 TaxID=1314785 RepID=A0A165CU11_9APHY|nr:uncharacterized protein LAESUDRAFT_716247 [Laetiporus sulphureus 93-53]KZT03432.1 hypothetical protein LAESUDRAFT_716247 [Laetiporus sulphureus 93-53]
MDQPLALQQQQQQPHDEQPAPFAEDKAPAKPPIVRGARACTVCRAAKMKCVGADDGNNIPCQRCKRSGAECIFEKHRRGRKPGSRLSEASKMLRRLEKGLNNAKQKHPVNNSLTLPPLGPPRAGGSRYRPDEEAGPSGSHFASNELPPLNLPPHLQERYPRSHDASDSEMDEDGEVDDENGMYPARLIKQNARHSSFFKTILNPEQVDVPVSRSAGSSERAFSQNPQSPSFPSHQAPTSVNSLFGSNSPLKDPVEAGLIDLKKVEHLWDMFYIRLNPFINLFDPALHSVEYVRQRSPFLFTALVMACCKFFQPELYQSVLRLAHDFAIRAFAENWKSVEVVQAFACMTYWKEPDDTRTWTYIGYACRMAVELGLNRYVGKRAVGEAEPQMRERRNRERTYLVLFVHDRSLSMQTGKHWMLPAEDLLVSHASTWHEEGGIPMRQEDVVVAAFTELRRIAAETTDVFNMHQGGRGPNNQDCNYEMLLRNCNQKLNGWLSNWWQEMERARGSSFHFSFMQFFQLHVRLFLNTFGINSPSNQGSGSPINVQALHMCYTSAMDNLRIMADDFAKLQMLRYGQDSTTVMTAYSAVVLMKLLRGPNRLDELKEGAVQEIHNMIMKTAKAYQDAAHLSPASSSAAYHARFLQSLVENDLHKMRQRELQQQRVELKHDTASPYPSRTQLPHSPVNTNGHAPQGYGHQQQVYAPSVMQGGQVGHSNGFHTPSSSVTMSVSPIGSYQHSNGYVNPHTREAEYAGTMVDGQRNDAMCNYSLSGISTTYSQYLAQPLNQQNDMCMRNVLEDLGFGEGSESVYTSGGYQAGVVGQTGAMPPAQTGYSVVSYRESENGYATHQPAQHYAYSMMGPYQTSACGGR